MPANLNPEQVATLRRMRAKDSLNVQDLRRLGLLDELPGAGAGLLEELRPKAIEELPQIRRDGLVRHFLLGGHKGKLSIDGDVLDLDVEKREILRQDG